MTIFRIHIIKIAVLFLFITGMVLVSLPGNDHAHPGESVATWLLEMRSDTENSDVYDKIYSLRSEDSDIPVLLRKASTIIIDHADDFTIPVDSEGKSNDDIYNTLLLKWAQNQQDVPADIVMITDRQTHVPLVHEKEVKIVWDHIKGPLQLIMDTRLRINQLRDFVHYIHRPLMSGLAIGAP